MVVEDSIKEEVLEDVKKFLEKGRTEIEIKIKPSGSYVITAKV